MAENGRTTLDEFVRTTRNFQESGAVLKARVGGELLDVAAIDYSISEEGEYNIILSAKNGGAKK